MRRFFFGKSRSRGLLSDHVCGKETLSFVVNAQIRHDPCSVSASSFAKTFAIAQLAFHFRVALIISAMRFINLIQFSYSFLPGHISFASSGNLIRSEDRKKGKETFEEMINLIFVQIKEIEHLLSSSTRL